MAKRVVILGGGYAGVKCAQTLERNSSNDEIEILLVNKHDYHQFMAQLHESAVGIGTNSDIRVPLKEIFNETKVKLVKDLVVAIKPKEDLVLLENRSINYDYLVISLGSEPEYFNIPGLEQHSLTLRSLNSAKMIRAHIEKNIAAFKAEPGRLDLLTVVVGGAGFTGIELAGELADKLPELAREYDIDENLIQVVNIEASSSILLGYDKKLIANAYSILQNKGVRLITDSAIESVSPREVKLSNGESIKTANFIWTGGIRANKAIAQAGFRVAVRGRAHVNKYLQAEEYPNVYLVGDNAFIINPVDGNVMGPTAQIAIQSGYMAALNIMSDIRGQDPQIFYPKELGRFVSLGRRVAVGKIGDKYTTTGRVAGMLKSAIHWKYLYSLGGFRLVAKKFLK